MNSITAALTLWSVGLATHEAIVSWADSEISLAESPSSELIELSLEGPAKCIMQAEYSFPFRPATLSFEQEFGLRGMFVDISSDRSVQSFAEWASRCCMGHDLKSPVVSFGYELDHLLTDCDSPAMAAVAVKARISELVKLTSASAQKLLALVPGLQPVAMLHRPIEAHK
jgi:hypothetical protein